MTFGDTGDGCISSFLLGTIVVSLIAAWSVVGVETMPPDVMSGAQVIVIEVYGHRRVFRKTPHTFREAFFLIVALTYVRLRGFRGEYFYHRSLKLTILYWTATAFGILYLLITTFLNVDVV